MTFGFSTLLLRENHIFSSSLPTGRNDLHRFAICFPEMKDTSHKKVILKQFFEPQHHPTLVSFPDPASQIEPTRFSPEKKRSMPSDRSSPAAKNHQSSLRRLFGGQWHVVLKKNKDDMKGIYEGNESINKYRYDMNGII